ncbi:MAG: ABC transporter substrate-binding protein [Spirochaetota bacterium]
MDEKKDFKEFDQKLTRRRFLKRALGGAAAGTTLLLAPRLPLFAGGKKEEKPEEVKEAAGPVTLDFVVWEYSVDTIQDNIKMFENKHPDISVKLTGYTWPGYHDTLVLRFKGKTKTDVLYCGEDWLPEWAAAGWLAPIEDYFSEINQYKDKIVNYALQDMTYNGKLYGLPYYADLITFQFNRQILEKNNISAPADWDQVLDACLKLKKDAGMDKPFIYEFNQTLPNFLHAFISQVYGRGGEFIDKDLNPVFARPGSETAKHLQWLQDANKKHKIMAHSPHETKVNTAMQTGQHAMTVMYNYMLAAMNRPPSTIAGQCDMELMPGKAHGCLGFCKFYTMTSQAIKEGRGKAAWTFIEAFGGGDYSVAKRWAVEKGLGFGQLPLFDAPDVIEAWGTWIDMEKFKKQAKLAKTGPNYEWTGIWSEFFRPLLAKGMIGEASVSEVLEQGAEKWDELKGLLLGE